MTDTKNIEEVAERLQDVGIQALAIHGRTRVQMYKGECRLGTDCKSERIIHGLPFRFLEMAILILHKKHWNIKIRYGVDGIMIGRAAIGYPWIFNEITHYVKTGEISFAHR